MSGNPTFHSATIPDSRLLQGLLGLRGLAAISVVLYHLYLITGLALPEGFGFIGRDFGYGAHLFFVLSAFSLMHSTGHTVGHPTWVRDYLVKRFFRIAPLFYLMLCLMLAKYAIQAAMSGVAFPVSADRIILNIFFVFGFFSNPDYSLVMLGWTIGVEMIFYVLFPVILVTVKTSRQALILLVLLAMIGYAARSLAHMEYLQANPTPRWDGSYFWFASNLYFFGAGIYAYRVAHEAKDSSVVFRVWIPVIAAGLIGVLLFTKIDQPLQNPGRIDLVVWAAGFAALCIWQSRHPSRWIASKFFEYTGERSYSVYLLHGPIILYLKDHIRNGYDLLQGFVGTYAFFLCAAVVLLLVMTAAEITYRLVEVPGIRLGRRIIGKAG